MSRALPVAAVAVAAVAAACSVEPLDSRDDAVKCAGTGVPAIACATGPTVPVCALDATGRWRWTITCPGQLDAGLTTGGAGTSGVGRGGSGGAAGSGGSSGMAGGGPGGGTGGAVACASTERCAAGEVCTTEDGDCKPPPFCGAGASCDAVCYGVCRPAGGTPCTSTGSCAAGEICTTEQGVCKAPPGCGGANIGCPAVCYGECRKAAPGGACNTDGDCHLEADYCTGCDCRALAKGETVAACPGPGVQCFADPCGRLTARCVNGKCAAQ